MTVEKILVKWSNKNYMKVSTYYPTARTCVHVYTYLCLKYQCASSGILCLNCFSVPFTNVLFLNINIPIKKIFTQNYLENDY